MLKIESLIRKKITVKLKKNFDVEIGMLKLEPLAMKNETIFFTNFSERAILRRKVKSLIKLKARKNNLP